MSGNVEANPRPKGNAPSKSGAKVLSEEHCTKLVKLTKKAADKWKTIGRELGFGGELDAIVREPGRHGDEDYYEAMLRRWLDWAPPNHNLPTLSALVDAIRKAGKERLAYELEQQEGELFGGCGDESSGPFCPKVIGPCQPVAGTHPVYVTTEGSVCNTGPQQPLWPVATTTAYTARA